MKDIWMWPQADINQTTVTDDPKVVDEIEQYFNELYSPYKVVYFSRARIALTAISAVAGLSRPKLTFVQPFSSHCVLSAISQLSTPTTTNPEQSDTQVIYHQWGHESIVDRKVFTNPLVEDAVDSLIMSNEKADLFPNDAPFCLISLPKVCATSIGAIVVCQSEDDYTRLIEQRMEMATELENPLAYIDIPQFKESILQSRPTLAPILTKSIRDQVEGSAQQIRENLSKLGEIFPDLSITSQHSNRLPANIMVDSTRHREEELYPLLPFNVIEKQRTFFNYQTLTCEKVWLLPSHCQATWTTK